MSSSHILDQLPPEQRERLAALVTQKRILQARTDLTAFAQLVYPNFDSGPFYRHLHLQLMDALAGGHNRLIIHAPPQIGKSTNISSIFPAWWLGNRPDDPVLIASYEADKAAEYSYAARNIVESDIYGHIFPGIRTRQDSRARNRWNIVGHQGRMFAAGAEGPIAGRGAMLGIIDDPIKGWKEASSKTVKDGQWEWYKTVFRGRVWERGVIIIVMTRWAEDDLVGRLLNAPGSAAWQYLRYAALAESDEERRANNRRLKQPEELPDILGRQPDTPLARYSKAYWDELRMDVGSRVWAGLYQGVPRPFEGNMIKREWFGTPVAAESVPYPDQAIRYWDNAGTEGAGAQTAGVLIARSAGKYYIWNVVNGNWSPHQRNKVVEQTAALDAVRFVVEEGDSRRPMAELKGFNLVAIWIEQEPGSGGKESAQVSTTMLSAYPVHTEPPSTGKDVRLMPFAAALEADKVRLVQGEWNEEYIDQLCAVPDGTLRDMADASAGAYNRLQSSGFAVGSVSVRPGRVDPW